MRKIKIEENKWNLHREDYGILESYVFEDSITDVDYNGRDLWISSLKKGRYCVKDVLSRDFVSQFCQRVANIVSKPFNKNNPVIEAETKNLRITIVHESVANTGTTICIRKTPTIQRLNEKIMLENDYCTQEMIDLLKSCVKAGLSIAVCGGMGCGV